MRIVRMICSHCNRTAFVDDRTPMLCPYCNSSDTDIRYLADLEPLTLSLMGYDKLNDEQRAIVLATEGINYVEAGPGTAKSTTLVFRTRYLIHCRRDGIHTPLLLTFTRQTVDQLVHAFLNEPPKQQPDIFTLHGFAYHLLWSCRSLLPDPYKDFRMMDVNDELMIYRMIQHEEPALCERFSDDDALKIIRQSKRTSPCLICSSDGISNDDELSGAFKRYQAYYGFLGFDDLLPNAVYLLRTFPAVLASVQDRYRYVLVDESQDLTDIELQLLDLITATHRNLFLVGDTDQSIYGWRGAQNRVVTWLDTLGVTVHRYTLTHNYRSSQVILDAARTVIEPATNRTPKPLIAVHPQGVKVMVKECPNPYREAQIIASSIEIATDRKSQPLPLNYADIAVLVRNRASLKLIRQALVKKRIPVSDYHDIPLLQTSLIQQIIHCLRYLDSPDLFTFSAFGDELVPEEYWSVFTSRLTHVEGSVMEALNHWYSSGQPTTARGSAFLKILNDAISVLAHHRKDAFSYVIETLLVFKTTPENKKNADEFRKLYKKLRKKTGNDLHLFLNQLAMATEEELEYQNTRNHVHLLTLHSSKGREFKKVFIAGVTAGIIPNPKGDPEEERRLLYVGITRAKEELVLSYYRNSYEHPEEPSPLIEGLLHSPAVIFCPSVDYRKKHSGR